MRTLQDDPILSALGTAVGKDVKQWCTEDWMVATGVLIYAIRTISRDQMQHYLAFVSEASQSKEP
jgi:hypothetical protein